MGRRVPGRANPRRRARLPRQPEPGEARAAREAARLVTLRGIGSTYAATLMASGIGTVEALAAADPDALWRKLHGGLRPTPAEVRVWVRAAQREGGSTPRLSDPQRPPP